MTAPDTTPAPPAAPGAGFWRGRRGRTTRRSVLIMDRAADWIITVGGLLVIVAVFGIMAFLAEVAAPLFLDESVEDARDHALTARADAAWLSTDEYHTVGLRLARDGTVDTFHLATGARLASHRLDLGGRTATALTATSNRSDVAMGFADGTVRFGKVTLAASVVTPESVPADVRALSALDRTDGTAVWSVLPGNQFRKIEPVLSLDEPQQVAEAGTAIVALDYRIGGTVERPTRSFVSIDAAGTARLSRAETRINLMTRKATTLLRSSVLPDLPAGRDFAGLALTTLADQVYIARVDGSVFRYDTRDFEKPTLAERGRLVPDGASLTAMGFLNGEQSLAAGGSDGSVGIFFRLPDDTMPDGYRMVRAHALEPHAAAVVAIAESQRRKTLVTSDAKGAVWLRHATSEQTLLKMQRPAWDTPDPLVVIAPRDDGVVSVDAAGRLDVWLVDAPHPETTVGTIFGKVWYEGYSEPTFTWQSSSGTDQFEPKFSLVPLIFGTLKATVYSLLFAIPISLLGAIYTSEFVHRRVRATIKPVMEMMESLPTVVLGFVAALILAPIVENWVAAVLLGFVALPMSLMAAAFLWQMLPRQWVLRLDGLPKFAIMFAVVAFGAWLAMQLGPLFERVLFAGDIKAWAHGTVGSGTPFLTFLLLPLAYVVVAIGFNRTIGHDWQVFLRTRTKVRAGALDLARWLVLLLAAVLLALLVASLFAALGHDPRGGIVDTYVQRNALVVGFVMGFAVIPNIYTLAEDALNAVPGQLRAASLAAGATPWQTAIWVVLPTAMSGVFAAVMIGMGRAVGETMIVVMAAGNTPVLDWNIFNGLRTLSANIAVELPEAVKGGTLYRMLFVAALTLFGMTFCINTVAEIIRQRFRKRAFQL